MAPRKPTPAQLRDRRARIAVVILGCVLLGVGGIQGPKLLKMLSGSNGSSSTNPAQTTGATTSGQTAAATAGVVVPAASPSAGQIDGFGLFSAQDPFRSQMPTTATSTGPSAVTTKATTTQAAPTAKTTTQAKTATAKQPPPPPVTFTTTTASTGVVAALLKINGKRALIGIGGTFPKKTPLFRFASVAGKRLRIGVVGGSFADGRLFLMLQPGREVTLLNESDGTRFVIRFVHITNAPPNLLSSPGPTAGAAAPAGFQPGATPTPQASATTTR